MSSSWQQLPEELQLSVLAYLDAADVKVVRRVCKSYTGPSSAVLFHTIHVSPNARSFDRAHNVAGVHRLAALVRSVVYHVSIMDGSFIDFEAFQNEVLKVKTRNILTMEGLRELEHQAETMHQAYLEEFDAQDEFEQRGEATELLNLLKKLDNLAHVETREEEGWSGNLSLKGYIERRTGVAPNFWYHGGGWPPFVNLFNVAIEVRAPLRSISAGVLDWRSLSDLVKLPGIRDCLQRIEKLHISLSNANVSPDLEKYLPSFTRILQACRRVEDLSLDFDEIPFERTGERHMKISQAVYLCKFPSLTRLRLNGMITHESLLAAFLEQCAPALKELHLGDISLSHAGWPDTDSDTSLAALPPGSKSSAREQGSVISLFWTVHNTCNLSKARLTGCFTNREDESWYAKPGIHQEGIRAQLERFLCGEDTCPMGSLDEYLKLKGDPSDSDEDVLALPVAKFEDESWEWSPELIQY